MKYFSSLTPACKFNIVESLRSNFSVLLPNIDSLSRVLNSPETDDEDDGGGGENGSLVFERVALHRNAFKIYTFFLVHIVLAEESSTSSSNTSKVSISAFTNDIGIIAVENRPIFTQLCN